MAEQRSVKEIFSNVKRELGILEAALFPAVDIPPVVVPPVVTPPAGPKIIYTIVPKNMGFRGDGWYGSNDLGLDQVCYLQARLTKPAQPGDTVKFVWEQETNVVIDGKKNIKTERDFPNDSDAYSNDYMGRTVGSGSHSITAENGDGKKSDGVVVYHKNNPKAWTTANFKFPLVLGKVQRITKEIRYSSSKNKPDGWVRITVDGKVCFESGGFICNGPRRDFGVQIVNANPGTYGKLPSGSYLEAKIISLEVVR